MINFEELQKYTVSQLRTTLTSLGGAPGNKNKQSLIGEIMKIMCGEIAPSRSNRGRPTTAATIVVEGYMPDKRMGPITLQDKSAKEWDKPFSGIVEILSSGYGTVYTDVTNLVGDVHIPMTFIKEFDLRTGDLIEGKCGNIKEKSSVEVLSITSVNGRGQRKERRPVLDGISARYSDQIVYLGKTDKRLSVIDKFCPIGMGQRTVIEKCAASNKTAFIKDLAYAIEVDNPDLSLIISLVDERPEEVSLFKEAFKSEIYASTFDKSAGFKIHMADLAFMRAKALFEEGKNVVLVVDSLSRLYKSYLTKDASAVDSMSQKHVNGAIGALSHYFAMARNAKVGSLTIIATVNKSDSTPGHSVVVDTLYEGCNQKIVLSEDLVETRRFPPVSLKDSNTQNIENLLKEEDFARHLEIKSRLISGEIDSATALDLIKD